MEMASTCPRPPLSRDAAPRKPVRGPHGGWQPQEIDALRSRIELAEKSGESLRSVFDEMGVLLGRKPNSIRNFYYAQLRDKEADGQLRTLPFETFSKEEIDHLIRSVLTARAQGLSVRACVRQLAGGDRTKMLRYQNKYRSVVRARPDLVRRIIAELAGEGVPFVSPYPGEGAPAQPPRMDALRSRAQQSGDPQMEQLLSSLDHLITLAYDRPAQDSGGDALRRADRYRAQCDVLRVELGDERERLGRLIHEAGEMVTLIKEYIALPEQDRDSAAFCAQAAQRLSAMECAMELT